MSKKQKMHVKIGDIVRVSSGLHKNEVGEILKMNRKTGKVLIKSMQKLVIQLLL